MKPYQEIASGVNVMPLRPAADGGIGEAEVFVTAIREPKASSFTKSLR